MLCLNPLSVKIKSVAVPYFMQSNWEQHHYRVLLHLLCPWSAGWRSSRSNYSSPSSLFLPRIAAVIPFESFFAFLLPAEFMKLNPPQFSCIPTTVCEPSRSLCPYSTFKTFSSRLSVLGCLQVYPPLLIPFFRFIFIFHRPVFYTLVVSLNFSLCRYAMCSEYLDIEQRCMLECENLARALNQRFCCAFSVA